MAIYYLDSSAVVKRYAREVGTDWILSLLDPAAGNTIYLARITAVEVVSAFSRQQAGSLLPASEAGKAISDFRMDLSIQYRLIELTPKIIDHAMTLAETHRLRGYDSIQLAAALEINVLIKTLPLPVLTFLSADKQLNAAALTEGLIVEDPNLH